MANNNNLDAIIGLGAVIGGLAAIAAIADETKPTATNTTRREPKPEYYIAKPSTGNRGTWSEARPVSTKSQTVEEILKDWLFSEASGFCRENGGVAVAIIRRLAHDGWRVVEDVHKDPFKFKVKVRHYSMAHDLIVRIDTTEVKLLADYFGVIKITRYGSVDYTSICALSDKENGYYERLARDIQAYLG